MKRYCAMAALIALLTIKSTALGTLYSWSGATNGNWNVGSNWSGSSTFPSTSADTASFPATGVNVNLNVNTTVNIVAFSGSGTYRIQGPTNTITMAGTTINAITTGLGNHVINAKLALAKNTDISTVSGSNLNIEQKISGPTRNARKLGTGVLSVQELDVNDMSVFIGTLKNLPITSTQTFSRVRSLTLSGGRFDLFNQPLLIDYTGASPAGVIRTYAHPASGAAPLYSTSTGITASRPRSLLGVGYYDTATLNSRWGPTGPYFSNAVDATTLIVRDTLLGDADLDLDVDFDDLLATSNGYVLGSTHWYQGDFNGNGVPDFGDILSLAQNYGGNYLTAGDSGSITANFEADWALAMSMTPEPGALGLIAATLSFSTRRRC